MRIDIKKVKGKEYLQYTDNDGHVYHIGSAVEVENWKIAYWLFGFGLDELQCEFVMKMRVQVAKRLVWTEELENMLEYMLGDGKNGYVGHGNFAAAVERVHGQKSMVCEELRRLIKLKFPHIRKKEELRRTVDYNRRLRQELRP